MKRNAMFLIVAALVATLTSAVACGSAPAAEPRIVEVEKIVEVEVVKEIPVEKVIEVVKEVPVEKVVEVEVIKEVPIEVEKIVKVEVVKEVPIEVEKVVEVVKEVPVEKIVEVVVTATPTHHSASRPTSTPVPDTATALPQNTRVTLDVGVRHSCALRESGEIVCWGDNEYGQSSPPVGRFISISGGGWYGCALRENGSAACWGYNKNGQTAAKGGRFTSIYADGRHACALRESGEIVCWGDNEHGRASHPNGHFTSVVDACALRENGEIVCWGDNEHGRANPPSGRFTSISEAYDVYCALRGNGTGVCWGKDISGTLDIDGPFTSISVGWAHTCALDSKGEAICWGRSDEGQTNAPGGRFTSISAGTINTCGLRESGKIVCWGDNEHGQSSPPDGRFAQPSAKAQSGQSVAAGASFDAASILARFSTTDAAEGEARANAANEIIAQYESGDADVQRVTELMNKLAPELSADERRRAVNNLSRLADGGEWNKRKTSDAVEQLAVIITGNEVSGEQRIAAAKELVDLYDKGELDGDRALGLLDVIAAELSIEERRQAAGALAKLSADGDLRGVDKMAAAGEVFRLVTGVPLNAEQRAGAAVDLAGLGVRVFGQGQFDDQEVDNAVTIIKDALSGNLTSGSLSNILGFGN